MPNNSVPLELARLRHELAQVRKGQRVAHGASIEGAALTVNDSSGSVRTILGVQGDGTVGVQAVNGPPPPQPSAPIVASVIGGVTVSWDGLFAGGAVIPMDWQRMEVHASITPGFDPIPATLATTIETAQGATVVVSVDTGVHVRLLARNTSGAASPASVTVGPFGPAPVVADDILDGAVTTLKLADDAVTQAKVAVGAIGTTEISDNAITTPKIVAAAVQAAQIDAEAVNASKIAAGAVTTAKLDALAVTSDKMAANSVIAGKIAAGAVTTTSLTVGIAQSIAMKLTDSMGDATNWTSTTGGTWTVLTGVTDAEAGGDVVQSSGPVSLERNDNTPFDPDALYRVTARVRTTTAPTTGTATVSAGLVGVAADGTTRVSSTGANTNVTGQHYIAANTLTVAVGTAWTTVTGYVQGRAATGSTTACPDPKDPGKVHTNVRYVRPSVRLLAGATGGNMQVDQVTVETVPTGVVNAVNIANGAITASKISAGAVDATALAADAITGKTITGGTITGSLIQTATSGARVTVNEAGANKILVYDGAVSSAIGELSDRGLLLEGTNGSIIWLDPDNTYPNLRFTNDDQSNEAVINVVENTPGSANLGLNSGKFTGNGYTDMKWRTFFGEDFWVAERIRDSSNTTAIGGRVFLNSTGATVGFLDTTNVTPDTLLHLNTGVAQLSEGRLQVIPPASSSSALFVDAVTGHTGNLIRASVNNVDKFKVDKDGLMTASNIVTGSVSITPSAANTPTSINVTGLNLSGTVHRAFVTAQSQVPGTVLECTATNVTATGLTIWVSRTNTTATNIWYLVIAS